MLASSALASSILPLSMSRAADLIAAGYVAIGRLSVSITISLARLATMGRAFCTSPSPNNSRDNSTAFHRFHVGVDIVGDDAYIDRRQSKFGVACQYQFQLSAGQFQRSERLLVFFASRSVKASWVLVSAVMAS